MILVLVDCKTVAKRRFTYCFLVRIYFAERPLRVAHLEVLENIQQRDTNMAQQAGWANKSVAKVIAEVIGNLSDPWVMNRLCLNEKPDAENEQMDKKKDARLMFKLCVNMASQRSWSFAPQWVNQPENWMGVLDKDEKVASEALKRISKDAKVISDAWKLLQEGDETCDLQA